ncbi:MAG: hypothetical protein A3I88_03560 [Candidatus Portnoybacteria bacterium RIFCSPLOWO2_12_FULL_39_9]|uniref:Phosphatidylglycerol--prolipoprotein diacylglyceryl transferase n=1 Tax=Candidatus Portnoybacteria bacterium RIFCSPHIGHO2_12_FULL_38_9 TaxID=1801997 RepID=A0A1G2FGH1_9BACT|nr:MAG: hypothetical protein A3H00_00485 [Candidatus Portnoybacteria bacterium RBG_13_40_8]OGZ35985.1 MAG: hypothetical protein A2646_03280 [Candidatus Portnoybacteria bacterium RIFCSPHIGHO2_02_FULL_39_12]OGZ36651.1 MAG: hypothetical protein A3J64_00965 [Candidatus Portnoybacteria bacterium RIFCSPHIGHO2_12_FULL_38_9]OGZ39523.1 MAG: hypothetical protein A3F21_02505 [Candidatus Portnoybacteria bacterium RIFCSPLOWO2_01_FULL_38_39]OGZ40014.1 MAG: hypothetical protein A3I88_03560 [Candidatus Portnoy
MLPYFIYDQITLGPITVYTWGFFVGLGFLAGWWLVLFQAKRKGLDSSRFFNLFIFILLGGLIGARLGYVLQFPRYYFFHPLEIFQAWAGGLMFYGGLLGALLLGWLYLRLNFPHRDVGSLASRISFWRIADLIAPAAALGISIGYIGCSLINDHQGALTALPWGILWPDGILRHPVAQYLVLNGLIMFFVLWFLRTRLKKPGQLFIISLFWYSLARFLLDFTRATDTYLADPHYWSLSISQWVSLGIILWITLLAKKNFYVKLNICNSTNIK